VTYRKRRLLHRRIFLGFSLKSHGHQELPHMTLNVFSGMHEQPQHRRVRFEQKSISSGARNDSSNPFQGILSTQQ